MKPNLEKFLRRAMSAHQDGRFQEAEKIYRSILRSHPKNGVANHNLGVLKVGLGKASLALPHFQTALEADVNQHQYWISYIDALIKLNQISRASKLLMQGRKRGLQGDAVDHLERQLSSSAKHDLVPSERASELISLYKQGDFNKALDIGIKLFEQFPNDPNVPNFLGTIKSNLGEHVSAIEYYNKAIELGPQNVQAHNNLGNALNELGRFEEAIISYRKAIELKSDYTDAHYNLGVVLSEVDRLSEAVFCYNKVIELRPDYAQAHNNLAMLSDILGKFDLATRHYGEAINLNPDHPEVHFNLARTLIKIKKYRKGEEHYLKVITLRPDFVDAYLELAMAFHSEGYQKKAWPLYRIAELLRNENGIEKVYLKHLNLSLAQTKLTQLSVSDNKSFLDQDSGFIRTNIPVGENLPKVLGSLPSISPEHEKYVAENKSASDIRKGGVKHSRGFNLFATSDPTIKLFEERFTNTVSEILHSKIFIEDSFFAIYEGRSAATPHHHLNKWDNEFNLHSVKYAAVYYVEVGDVGADQPGNLSLHQPDVVIQPNNGDLIIFPASRMHSAHYNGLKKRIILGINFYTI